MIAKKKERCVNLKEISLLERQLSAIQNGVTRVEIGGLQM